MILAGEGEGEEERKWNKMILKGEGQKIKKKGNEKERESRMR